jgi:ATP-dependent Lhr-like helicase
MAGLDTFHPQVGDWFKKALGEPTPAQAEAWPRIQQGENVLIAAPTGSGKTLAAFLAAINALVEEAQAGRLAREMRVVYVSPLKALSNDIHTNLDRPLAGIAEALKAAGQEGEEALEIHTGLRTGDTPQKVRQAIAKNPPHLLVTTPESLYLLLTSESGRRVLAPTQTVIVDEIHALAGNRRGAHLALSLERLDRLCTRPVQRIGLSATQNPIGDVARFLVGQGPGGQKRRCAIVDSGHRRPLDLALEVPPSPLGTVMSNEVWDEVYDRLAKLVAQHQTTLVFTNTRKLAERVTQHLDRRLGGGKVLSHHGSLSLKMRQTAEQKLREGSIKALVATASMELGIDVGHVDLVCQVESPRSINTFLQRVGRSGHCLGATPKGRIFPTTRDDLVECAALLRSISQGQLDRLEIPDAPLDVLGQQVVAEVAQGEARLDELFETFTRAHPYRNLSRASFDEVLDFLGHGYRGRHGMRGAHLYLDLDKGVARPKKGARLVALTSGGAIPDNADYQVVVDPAGERVGSGNEDFAVESNAGDIFQLGNHSWRITRVERGTVRVEDAAGLPPTIPFWLGEAPTRTAALSAAVSNLRADLDDRITDDDDASDAQHFAERAMGLPNAAADQLIQYLQEGKAALGAMPSQHTVVVERFFDELGGAQIVIHAPFGARILRAWGLALRKRFCRTFNFELQAAASDDAIVISVGKTDDLPLQDLKAFLTAKTVRSVLVQALLDAPMFVTRWRWNANRFLTVLRRRGGKKVAPQWQRIDAEDLMLALFPDQVACLENIPGDREIPHHPMVDQTVDDCLHEAMDIKGLESLLENLASGSVQFIGRESTTPSPFAHAILNAKPYAFLDDAPLEERRTQAVLTGQTGHLADARGPLDRLALDGVLQSIWPDVENDDEVHEMLWGMVLLPEALIPPQNDKAWKDAFSRLEMAGRVRVFDLPRGAGRAFCTQQKEPDFKTSGGLEEMVVGLLSALPPLGPQMLSRTLGVGENKVRTILDTLKARGEILEGHFSPDAAEAEVAARHLVARVRRQMVRKLRAATRPVSPATFSRFLLDWHGIAHVPRPRGRDALLNAIEQLQGYSAPAAIWHTDLLGARIDGDLIGELDGLCMAGKVGWGRLIPPTTSGPRRFRGSTAANTPIAFFVRGQNGGIRADAEPVALAQLPAPARQVHALLEKRGALFFDEIRAQSKLLPTQVEEALEQLVAAGWASSDGAAGLRALLNRKGRRRNSTRRRGARDLGFEMSGRWSLIARQPVEPDEDRLQVALDACGHLLRRYGVLFRRLLEREQPPVTWREMVRALRLMEIRGEVRGGRFVSGPTGEQFALPRAAARLRNLEENASPMAPLVLHAADPANLLGTLLAGERLAILPGNRVLFDDGLPVGIWEGRQFTALIDDEDRVEKARAFVKFQRPLGRGLGVRASRRA